jgi:hypothetical protein
MSQRFDVSIEHVVGKDGQKVLGHFRLHNLHGAGIQHNGANLLLLSELLEDGLHLVGFGVIVLPKTPHTAMQPAFLRIYRDFQQIVINDVLHMFFSASPPISPQHYTVDLRKDWLRSG